MYQENEKRNPKRNRESPILKKNFELILTIIPGLVIEELRVDLLGVRLLSSQSVPKVKRKLPVWLTR